MKLKIFDKYLFKEVFLAGSVCILLFMVIWIAPELLLKTIQRTLSGDYTVKLAVSILIYEIPKILGNALPVGLLLGTLFTFDKMSKDFELTTFRSVGLSFWRIIAPIMALSLLVASFAFFVEDKLIPYSANKLNIIKNENPGSHFVFPVRDDDGKMQRIIIVSSFDNSVIKDLVVLDFAKTQYLGSSLLDSIYVADYARYSHYNWVLHEARKYLISTDGIFREVSTVKNFEILSGEKAKNAHKLMKFSVKRDRELNNSEMFRYIKLLKKERMDDEFRFMLNKYIQRYAHAIICFLFAILGCLLGFSQPRDQRLVGFTVAVSVIFLYYITMPFFDLLAEKGILSPIITATIQPIAVLTAVILIKKRKDL